MGAYEYKPISAKDYAQTGYEVLPGNNGGFVVLYGSMYRSGGEGFKRDLVAFTNATDMITWLTKGHAEAEATSIPAAG